MDNPAALPVFAPYPAFCGAVVTIFCPCSFMSRNRQKIRWTTSVASVAIGFLLILFVYVFSVLSNDFLYLRSIRFIVPYEIVKF